MSEGNTTANLQQALNRLQQGDDSARNDLIAYSCERLRMMAHRMIRGYPSLQRWEQTSDVLQNASFRLYRSLIEVRPTSVGQFFGLAATQIRRELLDLCRHHFGPARATAHYATPSPQQADAAGRRTVEPADVASEPGDLDEWTKFHEQVKALPDEERQVVDLLFYQGLSQAEVASVLKVSVRTVKRHWHTARRHLQSLVQNPSELM